MTPTGLQIEGGDTAPRITGTLAVMAAIAVPTIFILINALA